MIETRRVKRRAKARTRAARWLSPVWPLLFLLVIGAGERLIGEQWWVTTWALYAPQPLFLVPSVALGLLALLLGRGRTFAGHLAVVLLGVLLLCGGAWRLPRPAQRGDLRVMTWNVETLRRGPADVLAVIRREAPDLLLLQEASRGRGPDPVNWLRERLGGWNAVRAGDVAILTPHPMGRARSFPLGPRGARRVALHAPVRLRGRTVDAVVAHYHTALPRPIHERVWRHPRHYMQVAAAVRAEQTRSLVRYVRDAPRPLIVGGDFNSPPGSRAERAMTSMFQSAFAAGGSGLGWTFPSRLALLRIDHLFVSHDLRVLNCRVIPTGASDHRPVVADLSGP